MRIIEKVWSQSSLPVRFGELGLRRAVDTSLPPFISSVHATSFLVEVLTSRVNEISATIELVEVETLWDELSGRTVRPTAEFGLKQSI